MKELVDGTLRVQIDIDPRFRKQFFELFGQIDMPVALAPLTTNFERPEEKIEQEKSQNYGRIGPLGLLAVRFCEDPQFAKFIEPIYEEWLGDVGPDSFPQITDYSRHCILAICEIETRKELDTNQRAAMIFHERIRKPFLEWRESRE